MGAYRYSYGPRTEGVIYGKNILCQNASDDMNMFVNGGMLNENLTRCRNAYRIQNGLLTSKEIAGIREEYGLTSEEFSKILGFKEDRIKRLEAKVIQDKETDQLIRRFHTDKDFAADLVQKVLMRCRKESQKRC